MIKEKMRKGAIAGLTALLAGCAPTQPRMVPVAHEVVKDGVTYPKQQVARAMRVFHYEDQNELRYLPCGFIAPKIYDADVFDAIDLYTDDVRINDHNVVAFDIENVERTEHYTAYVTNYYLGGTPNPENDCEAFRAIDIDRDNLLIRREMENFKDQVWKQKTDAYWKRLDERKDDAYDILERVKEKYKARE